MAELRPRTTTVTADGRTIIVVAETKAEVATAVIAAKLYAKPTRPNIKDKADANKKHSEVN
jgi:hypothetical protein